MAQHATTTPAQADEQAERIAEALTRLGPATPRQIADATGVAYSTTNKKLALLSAAGRAHKLVDGNRTVWQAARAEMPDPDLRGTDAPGTEVTPAQQAAGTDDPIPDAPESDAANTEDREDPARPEAAADSDAAAGAVLDPPPADPDTDRTPDQAADRGVPATSPPPAAQATGGAPNAPTEPATAAVTHQPDDPGAPTVAEATVAAGARAEATATADPPSGRSAAAAPEQPDKPNRRPAGSMRGAILDIVEANPTTEYTISDFSKLINQANEGTGASTKVYGAVANASAKLAAQGRLVLTREKPVTYRLAAAASTATDGAGADS